MSQSIPLTASEAKQSARLNSQKANAMIRGDGDAVDRIEERQAALDQTINRRVGNNRSSLSPMQESRARRIRAAAAVKGQRGTVASIDELLEDRDPTGGLIEIGMQLDALERALG